MLASGTFTTVPGTATVEVYRDADRAWVVDPSGAVTDVSDPRIEELAGPWACWQLYEQEPAQTPAVIEAVWAGMIGQPTPTSCLALLPRRLERRVAPARRGRLA